MLNTLIVYEEGKYGTAQKTAETFGYLLGNTHVCDVEKAPSEITKYENMLLVFSLYGPQTAVKTKKYIQSIESSSLGRLKIGLVGVGLSTIHFDKYLEDITTLLGRTADYTCFILGELRIAKLSKEDLQLLEMFKKTTGTEVEDKGEFDIKQLIHRADEIRSVFKTCTAPMEKDKLRAEIEKFIIEHNTMALATAHDGVPRCSPVEYQYLDGKFYIVTEGGQKFAGILQNGRASIGIYNNYTSMGSVYGMQITATVQIVPLFSQEYNKVFEKRGISQETIKKLPISLYVISLTPRKYEVINSDFKKLGYDPKQQYSDTAVI